MRRRHVLRLRGHVHRPADWQRPQKASAPRYGAIVLGAMGFVAVLFALVATVAASAFPRLDSSSITAFLAAQYAGTPSADFFAGANLVVTAAVVATFPLQLAPAALLIDAALGLRALRARLAARVVTVSCCCVLVLQVKDLSVLIDLVGAVANTAIALLPAAIHAKVLLTLPGFRLARADAPHHAHGGGSAAPALGMARASASASALAVAVAVAAAAARAARRAAAAAAAMRRPMATPAARSSVATATWTSAAAAAGTTSTRHSRGGIPRPRGGCRRRRVCAGLMATGVAAEVWCLVSHDHSATRECD